MSSLSEISINKIHQDELISVFPYLELKDFLCFRLACKSIAQASLRFLREKIYEECKTLKASIKNPLPRLSLGPLVWAILNLSPENRIELGLNLEKSQPYLRKNLYYLLAPLLSKAVCTASPHPLAYFGSYETDFRRLLVVALTIPNSVFRMQELQNLFSYREFYLQDVEEIILAIPDKHLKTEALSLLIPNLALLEDAERFAQAIPFQTERHQAFFEIATRSTTPWEEARRILTKIVHDEQRNLFLSQIGKNLTLPLEAIIALSSDISDPIKRSDLLSFHLKYRSLSFEDQFALARKIPIQEIRKDFLSKILCKKAIPLTLLQKISEDPLEEASLRSQAQILLKKSTSLFTPTI